MHGFDSFPESLLFGLYLDFRGRFRWLVFNLSGFKFCECPRFLLHLWWLQGPLSPRSPRAAAVRIRGRSWVLGGCPATSRWDVLPPSHALSEVHLIFFILWASIQLCCCFHWGAEWFLFLSPGGLYQWGKHFVLGTTERKMNVSALVHYSFRNKSLKCLIFCFLHFYSPRCLHFYFFCPLKLQKCLLTAQN